MKTKDDKIDKDSEILDGKRWEDIWVDNFIPRSTSPFPKQNTPKVNKAVKEALVDFWNDLAKTDKEIAEEALSDSSKDTVIAGENGIENIPFDPFHDEREALINSLAREQHTQQIPELKDVCCHDWLEYQGAGTKKPETICKICGTPKV